MINIVCFKWGNWDEDYVHRLKNMVKRHLTVPHKFICFSDTPIRGINCSEIPEDALNLQGNFTKLWVYSANNGLSGRTIMLDLDVVIVGSLDEMFSYSGDWCGIRGFGNEGKPKIGGALVSFNRAKYYHLWENRHKYTRHKGAERFVYGKYVPEADLWQDLYSNQVASYKWHVRNKLPPQNLRFIAFHGHPRPHEVSDKFIRDNWK